MIELRGPGALAAAEALAPRVRLSRGELRLVTLESGGERLDRALVAVLDPQRVELHLHGGRSVAEAVLAALGGESPADEAPALESRARRLLAAAPSEDAARILLDQSEGALRRELEELRGLPDDAARARIDALLERARVARFALRPVRVLLRGPVNAGKSTLFNALCGADRVLVGDEPGTTRDVVREVVRLGAWPVELWDTPGERTAAAPRSPALELEQAGLELAHGLERAAQLVLWLCPPGERPPEPARFAADLLVLDSRADERPAPRGAAISAHSDPEGAVREVARRFRERYDLPSAPWSAGQAVPFEERQVEALRAARDLPRERRGQLVASLLEPAR